MSTYNDWVCKVKRYSLGPAQRGALFYGGFWGVLGVSAPFVSVYFVGLGLSKFEIGLLSTLPPLMTLLVAPALSALADRHARRRRMMQWATVMTALTTILLGIPEAFVPLAVVTALGAVFRSLIAPIGDSLMARVSARYGLNLGNMRLWGSVTFAGAAILCGMLWERVGYKPMFVLSALLFLPMIFVEGRLEEGPPVDHRDRQSFRELGADRGLIVILVATFLVGVGMTTTLTFGGVYMDALGGGEFLIGMLFGVSAFSELPTMQYSNAIVKRLGGPKTLLLAYGLFGIALLGHAAAPTPWVLLLAVVVRGLAFGLFHISTVYLVDARVPQEWSSTAQAMINAASMGLAPLVAAPIGGQLYDTLGPRVLFAVAGLVVGLAMLFVMAAATMGLFHNKPVVQGL